MLFPLQTKSMFRQKREKSEREKSSAVHQGITTSKIAVRAREELN